MHFASPRSGEVGARSAPGGESHRLPTQWGARSARSRVGSRKLQLVPVGPYVVDFMCVSDRLAIEVDGSGHEDEEKDDRKTKWLLSHGYRVLRIPVSDVDESMDDVIHGLYLELAHPTRLG